MIIKFGYYDDEDFGLTAFPEIKFSEKEITKNNKKNGHLEKKKAEYTKYLITGIMEDFPDVEFVRNIRCGNVSLKNIEKFLKAGKSFQKWKLI